MQKILRALVSGGLLAWLAWRTDWEQIRQACAHLRAEFWIGAVALYLGIQWISGFRWQLLAKPLGFHKSICQYTSFYFIGMFFNLFLPTSVGGDVVRAWYLDGGSGRKMPAFLSVLVDRGSGLAVLLVLACAMVAFCPLSLPKWIEMTVWSVAGAGIVGVPLAFGLLRWSSRFDRARRLSEDAAVYLRHPRLIMITVALSFIIQAGNVVLVWLVGQAVQAPVPAFYYWIMVPMVTLLTMVPVSLNGMGVREGGTILFLTPLGVPHATALSLAVLWFGVFTAASLSGGVLYLAGRFPKPVAQSESILERNLAA